MKKILLIAICVFTAILYSRAQTLYGVTFFSDDNQESGGTIIKFLPATNTLRVAQYFDSLPYDNNSGSGYNPSGSLINGKDGKLYGVTTYGGIRYGAIFSFDHNSRTYKKLHDF